MKIKDPQQHEIVIYTRFIARYPYTYNVNNEPTNLQHLRILSQ